MLSAAPARPAPPGLAPPRGLSQHLLLLGTMRQEGRLDEEKVEVLLLLVVVVPAWLLLL